MVYNIGAEMYPAITPKKGACAKYYKKGDLLQKFLNLLSDKRVVAAVGVLVLAVMESATSIER